MNQKFEFYVKKDANELLDPKFISIKYKKKRVSLDNIMNTIFIKLSNLFVSLIEMIEWFKIFFLRNSQSKKKKRKQIETNYNNIQVILNIKNLK